MTPSPTCEVIIGLEVHVQLATATKQLGRVRSAIGWYRAVLGLDPDNEQAAEALRQLDAEATELSTDNAATQKKGP